MRQLQKKINKDTIRKKHSRRAKESAKGINEYLSVNQRHNGKITRRKKVFCRAKSQSGSGFWKRDKKLAIQRRPHIARFGVAKVGKVYHKKV